MTIHVCRRCEGSGHVTGGHRWEMPWSRWASASRPETGFLEPQPCPDCGGTGVLIELEGGEVEPAIRLVSRRGLGGSPSYADHVARILASQRFRRN